MPTTYAIPNGRTVFDATTWTGDGTSSRSITNTVGFKPDFVWGKSRSQTIDNCLYDSVRGAGANTELVSNNTNAEGDGNQDTFGYLSAFNTNGFSTVNGSSGTNYYFNFSGQTYVAWQWQAGQGVTSSNTNGSITSTVSVNATAGFSVVTWAGSGANGTVGHGLGVVPSMYIVKNRTTGSTEWVTYHSSLPTPATSYLTLQSTAAVQTGSIIWNSTAPTSSVFSLYNLLSTNNSGNNYVAYCWAQIAGFSAFGSYTGNGSTDGPFIYTGFRPKFILVKRTTGVDDWRIFDTSRDTYNAAYQKLYPNLSAAENGASGESSSTNILDILSNGFKWRTGNSGTNNSGDTYIYAAFAENPFKYANAR